MRLTGIWIHKNKVCCKPSDLLAEFWPTLSTSWAQNTHQATHILQMCFISEHRYSQIWIHSHPQFRPSRRVLGSLHPCLLDTSHPSLDRACKLTTYVSIHHAPKKTLTTLLCGWHSYHAWISCITLMHQCWFTLSQSDFSTAVDNNWTGLLDQHFFGVKSHFYALQTDSLACMVAQCVSQSWKHIKVWLQCCTKCTKLI